MTVEVRVPISIGELLDKISILEIKFELIEQEDRLVNIKFELALLKSISKEVIDDFQAELLPLIQELKRVNRIIWDAEAVIHGPDAVDISNSMFLHHARLAFDQNDRRARLKRRINDIVGSVIVEEKSYEAFGQNK